MQITVNETGARTLADARPMLIDGHKVYVVVSENEAALMVAGRVVAVTSPEGMNTAKAQTWAVEYRESLAVQVADEAAVADATDPERVYTGAVAQIIRTQGAALLAKAEAAEAHGDAPYRYINDRGRVYTFTADDPRHPVQAAKSYRLDVEILTTWTAEDESGYGQYVSQGIGDTDGYFAPMDRAQWKRFLGA